MDVTSTKVLNEIVSVGFDMYTSEQTRKISVKSLKNSIAFDNLKRPNPEGLYDLSMGPSPYEKLGM